MNDTKVSKKAIKPLLENSLAKLNAFLVSVGIKTKVVKNEIIYFSRNPNNFSQTELVN